MAAKNLDNLLVENAELAFKNFSGREGNFNPEGDRNFCVILDDEVAKKIAKDGWNVKYLKPRDPEDKEQPYLKVKVRFGNRPPKIVIMTSRGKTILNEGTVDMLDWADIESVDLIINPYQWKQPNGSTGISAYLKSMYVKIFEDELEKKYIDAPDSAESSIGGCGECEACDGKCHED